MSTSSGIRMSGLVSGLDTESIVKELMKAESTKKTKVENKKTKLEWKKDIWKDLNTKIYKFYTSQVSKMKMSTAFKTKAATSSDETKATVTASTTASNGNYTLEVGNLATSQYITGASIAGSVTSATKLSVVDSSLENKEVTITNGDKKSYLQVTATTTVGDFVNALTTAGLNASYDATQKRFFIGASNSGAKSGYSISTVALDSTETGARQKIYDATSYRSLSSANQIIVNDCIHSLSNNPDTTSDTYTKALAKLETIVGANVKANSTANANNYVGAYTAIAKAGLPDGATSDEISTQAVTLMKAADSNFSGASITDAVKYYTENGVSKDNIDAINNYITDNSVKDGDKIKSTYGLTTMVATTGTNSITNKTAFTSATGIDTVLSNYVTSVTPAQHSGTSASTALTKLGLDDVKYTLDSNGLASLICGNGTDPLPDGMAVVKPEDASITLNGATLTSATNNVTINGLTITLKSKTSSPVSLSVNTDVDSIYTSIKSFLTDYNTLLGELNDDYYATTAKGYEPLTDDQKESMTDDQIEKWETKIKDSLLRRDDTLEGIINTLKSSMMGNVEVDGKKYSLSYFGISTSTDYTEKGKLHIYGDPDDSVYANKTDKLKAALTEDPQKVVDIFTGIMGNLSNSMQKEMKSTSLKSAMTFYNDKEINKQLDKYEDDMDEWDDKLSKMEDSYYAKFTAMEKAMASLNSQQSALSGLFGSAS